MIYHNYLKQILKFDVSTEHKDFNSHRLRTI